MRQPYGAIAGLWICSVLLLTARSGFCGGFRANAPDRTNRQKMCNAYLESVNRAPQSLGNWTSRGDEVTVRITPHYFELASDLTDTINDALRCAAAAEASQIVLVKYVDQDSRKKVLEWKEGIGFRAVH